jgi:hypothetical protein
MIILPAECNSEENTKKEYYDEFGNKFVDIFKKVSINPTTNIGRMDKIALMIENTSLDQYAYKRLYKECAIGPILKTYKKADGPVIDFNSYTYSLLDKHDGAYIQSGGYCPYPNDPNVYMCHGYSNELFPEIAEIEDNTAKKRISPSLGYSGFSLDTMDNEIQSFENIYQLPYTETFGLLSAFFSALSLGYPIQCYILIDSVRKQFNIPGIKYLLGIEDDFMRKIYITLVHEMGLICDYLFRILEKEKSELIIKVFIYPFGSLIRIHNCDNNVERFNNYMSNQIHSVMKNLRADGLKYIESESLNILQNCSLNEPIEQALDNCDTLY